MSNNLSLWDLYNKQNELLVLLNTHNHNASNLTGFSNVATSGSFNDLKDIPTIVNTVNGMSGKVTLTNDHVNAISKNASCNKNWNYIEKTGQPKYVWGGNDNLDMYIYNPSNFSVSSSKNSDYAISAGIAGNANTANNATLLQNRDLCKEVDDLKSSVVNGKTSVADAINDKLGTSLSDQTSFEDMANHINNLYSYLDMSKFLPVKGSLNYQNNNGLPITKSCRALYVSAQSNNHGITWSIDKETTALLVSTDNAFAITSQFVKVDTSTMRTYLERSGACYVYYFSETVNITVTECTSSGVFGTS